MSSLSFEDFDGKEGGGLSVAMNRSEYGETVKTPGIRPAAARNQLIHSREPFPDTKVVICCQAGKSQVNDNDPVHVKCIGVSLSCLAGGFCQCFSAR